jgi:chorismate mutase/prephenate dehydratase
MSKEIEDIRHEINALDEELIRLLNRRASLSIAIGRMKRATDKDIFDPSREDDIIHHLCPMIEPPLTKPMVERLFREIFSISRAIQQKQKVAFLGPEGSFSHQVAFAVFSLDGDLLPMKDIDSVIEAVASSRADLGVVPVENSTEGMINRTLDMMATTRLSVCQEILLPIRNCLLSVVPKEKIIRVYSHPQPLAQCRGWLMTNLPQAEIIETTSTSDAAISARSHDNSAAIASAIASELYGLPIIADNINDFRENITRFWIITRAPLPVAGKAKTSIIVTLDNVPGALYNALGVFARNGINLTKIESRPSRKSPWEYLFFIDFQGNLIEDHVKTAMEEIRQYTKDIIVLGSYPEGRTLS